MPGLSCLLQAAQARLHDSIQAGELFVEVFLPAAVMRYGWRRSSRDLTGPIQPRSSRRVIAP